MTQDSPHEPIVQVSKHASPALAEPKFIIKVGEVYYVTLAAWAYEPDKAVTEEHRAGIEEVTKLFRKSEPVEARMPPTRDPFGAGHTSPGGTVPSGTGSGTGSNPKGGKSD